jgi:hypothetical protein
MSPRAAVFGERRQFNQFGAQDDWRSIVQRRLVALQYTMNDQGAVVDSSGNIIVDAGDDTGTGTPAQLAALGYTPDQIAIAAGSVSGNVSGAAGASAISSGGTSPSASANSNTSWISGLSGLFGSIGTTLTNVTRATKSTTINPATGLAYGINPQTGKPYTTSQQGQVSLLLIVVVLVIAWAVFRA